MARLCGRPGCSETGAVAYGMIAEDLLFWMSPLEDAPVADASVLCRRHADAMVVPLGWTLDDRREDVLRLFRPRPADRPVQRQVERRERREHPVVEQLQIDGTGEFERPDTLGGDGHDLERGGPWEPDFDPDDDLDGLLEVQSPLLARAFRGTDRPKR